MGDELEDTRELGQKALEEQQWYECELEKLRVRVEVLEKGVLELKLVVQEMAFDVYPAMIDEVSDDKVG